MNISKIWGSSELAEKRALHKSIFPGGIYYDAQNHEYLTRETNKFIELVSCISTSLEQKESGIPQENIEKSRSVVTITKLSNQMATDFIAFYSSQVP